MGEVTKEWKFDFACRFFTAFPFSWPKSNFPTNFPPHSHRSVLERLIINKLQKWDCLWVLSEVPKRRVCFGSLLIINDLQNIWLDVGCVSGGLRASKSLYLRARKTCISGEGTGAWCTFWVILGSTFGESARDSQEFGALSRWKCWFYRHFRHFPRKVNRISTNSRHFPPVILFQALFCIYTFGESARDSREFGALSRWKCWFYRHFRHFPPESEPICHFPGHKQRSGSSSTSRQRFRWRNVQ